jgi:hypothetical protein
VEEVRFQKERILFQGNRVTTDWCDGKERVVIKTTTEGRRMEEVPTRLVRQSRDGRSGKELDGGIDRQLIRQPKAPEEGIDLLKSLGVFGGKEHHGSVPKGRKREKNRGSRMRKGGTGRRNGKRKRDVYIP